MYRPAGNLGWPTAVGMGLLGALGLLSRPDNALLLGISAPLILLHLRKSNRLSTRFLVLAMGSFFAVVLPWLIFKFSFYGTLLPNTFYAKTGGRFWGDGLRYVGLFFLSYGLFLPLGIGLLRVRALRPALPPGLGILGLLSLAWTGYLIWIGGDFMHFRMWIPVLPALYIGAVFVFSRVNSLRLRFGLLGLLLLANVLHAPGFGRWYPTGFVFPLQRWTASSSGTLSFAAQGAALKQVFATADPPLRIAVGAAGALPYFAGLYTLDMYGLSDPAIARDGLPVNYGPGHRQMASLDYLEAQGIHLWIYRCDPAARPPDLSTVLVRDPYFAMARAPSSGKDRARLRWLQLPVAEGFVLHCAYLTEHPQLEAGRRNGAYREIELALPASTPKK